MSEPVAKWYVVVSAFGQAISVRNELIAAGYDAYVPIERVARTRGRKRVAVDQPLFGPYLFVEVKGDEFPDARGIEGMQGFIGNAGPRSVRDQIINDLKTAEARGLFDATTKSNRVYIPLARGDAVRVLGGPFSEFMGQVMACRGKKRVDVLLSLFGRAIEINIETAELMKVS